MCGRDATVFRQQEDKFESGAGPVSLPLELTLGPQQYFCYTCYCAIRRQLCRDVVYQILSLVQSLIARRRDRIDFSCSPSTFFEANNEIYFCGALPMRQYAVAAKLDFQPLNFANYVVQLAIGNQHMLVLLKRSDETVLCSCGKNARGQLGLGHFDNLPDDFAKVGFFESGKTGSVISIHCGNATSIVWTTTGLYGFGCDAMGQLGRNFIKPTSGTRVKSFDLPFDVLADSPDIQHHCIKSVFCGNACLMILMIDGTVYACGENTQGQLGVGSEQNIFQLRKVLLTNVIGIATGSNFTVFQTPDGLFVSGDTTIIANIDVRRSWKVSSPIPLPFNHRVASIKSGLHHLAILTESRDLYCCGFNGDLAIGVGPTSTKNITTPMEILSNVVHYQCGYFSNIATTGEGKLYYWGDPWSIRRSGRRGLGTPIELEYYEQLMLQKKC